MAYLFVFIQNFLEFNATKMGIPSYFSYIIRNHPEIITNLEQLFKSSAFQYSSTSTHIKPEFQHLFFDANSLIYDAFHKLSAQHRANPIAQIQDSTIFFPLLTQHVIELLEKHIQYIQPTETLFIAFDGLPPPAKIVQQKSRRFKTRHMEQMMKQIQQIQQKKENQSSENPSLNTFPWQTSMITPGTPFMTYLSEHLTIHFNQRRINKQPLQPPIQILSTSTEPGEGEHKIFNYLRNHPPKSTDQIALYGLDSDLIMLSLLSVPNIYIFREAPAFLASKIDDILQNIHLKHKFSHTQSSQNVPQPPPIKLEDLPPYFLNINLLSNAIRQDQYTSNKPSLHITNPVYDYVFMCFLLGNDFLPHIPALNLRTNGLHTLLKYYQQKRTTPLQLIEPTTQQIQWKQLHQLLQPIAKSERELLIQENHSFRKMPKPAFPNLSKKHIQPHYVDSELQDYITSAPQIYTSARDYIHPEIEKNWQQRYRKVFPTACPLRFLKQMNDTWEYYLGRLSKLEYTTDAPPLLGDIVETLQDFQPQQIESIAPLQKLEFQNNEDYLAYVLSETPMTYDFTFSKMLWEVHVH
jgi:5'-3' exonuclease